MKRTAIALTATLAFAASPALADNHGEQDMADEAKAKKDYIQQEMNSEVTALKASQVFLAIDDENDGLITKEEWADWQNRSGDNTKQFADYDMDGDGDIELSEYLENFDIS